MQQLPAQNDDFDEFCSATKVTWAADIKQRGGDDYAWMWRRACASALTIRARDLGDDLQVFVEKSPYFEASMDDQDDEPRKSPMRMKTPLLLDSEPDVALSPLLGMELKVLKEENAVFESMLAALQLDDDYEVLGTNKDNLRAPSVSKPLPNTGTARSLKRALDNARLESDMFATSLKRFVVEEDEI